MGGNKCSFQCFAKLDVAHVFVLSRLIATPVLCRVSRRRRPNNKHCYKALYTQDCELGSIKRSR